MSKQPLTTADLARELGFSVTAFSKWRKSFPDAPAGIDVTEWKAFIGKHGLGTKGNHLGETARSLRDQKTAEEIRALRMKNAKEERKLISADDVDSFLLFLSSRIKSSLYQSFQTELPPKTAGLDVAQVRLLNREGCDGIMRSMQALQDEWAAEQEAAREAAKRAAEAENEQE